MSSTSRACWPGMSSRVFPRPVGQPGHFRRRGGRHEIMEPGEYPFSIEVTVPQDAPPAHAGKNSRIFYESLAWVAIPLAVDLKAKHSFDLPPLPGADPPSQPVRVRYPGDAGAGLLDSLLAPGVRVELALAADVAREGETIEGIIVTESDKPSGAQSPVGELGRDRAQSGPGSPRHRSLRQPACPNLLIPLIGGALLADIFATRRVSRAANLARHTVQYRLVCPVGAGCALGQGSQDSRPRPAAKKVVCPTVPVAWVFHDAERRRLLVVAGARMPLARGYNDGWEAPGNKLNDRTPGLRWQPG